MEAPTLPPAVTYRGYQNKALDNALSYYSKGTNDQLLVMATGCGKTWTFAGLPYQFPDLAQYGMLVLVHRDELVFQAVEKIRIVNPHMRVGIEKAQYHADPSCEVVVASVQTLGQKGIRRLKRLMYSRPFGIIVIDEAHHATPNSQYDRVLNALGVGSERDEEEPMLLPNGKRRLLFGVTATPNRNDKVGLSHFFSEIVFQFGIEDAVKQGYLTDIEHYRIETGQNIGKVKKRAGDFAIGDLSDATNNQERNNLIVSAYLKYSADKSSLAFCSSVEHAHDLAGVFNAAGVPAAAVDGTTDRELRKQILQQHEEGEIKVVTNFGVLTEGYDGRVHSVLMARPTQSQPLYVQMLGRGLRTIPSDLGNLETQAERLDAIANSDKPACVLLDFVDVGHEVVTVPSLFGLPKLDGKGRQMIRQIVEHVNEAIEENPHNADAIREATDFEEVEVQAKKVNVWGVAKSFHSLQDITDHKWIKLGDDAVQIEIPREDRPTYLRLDQNVIGKWDLTVIRPRQWDRVNRQHIPEERVQGRSFNSMADGIKACDAKIKKDYPEVFPLIHNKARWRMGKPTQGQMKYLQKLGIDTAEVNSKGVASDLISAAKQLKS